MSYYNYIDIASPNQAEVGNMKLKMQCLSVNCDDAMSFQRLIAFIVQELLLVSIHALEIMK